MRFARAFFIVLRRDPARAMGALGWWLAGRKMRARNRLHIAAAEAPDAYRLWIERVEAKIPPPAADGHIQITALAEGDGPLADQIAAAQGGYLLLTAPGTHLAPHWRGRFAEALAANPAATVLYADCDVLGADGNRQHPWFKPRWDADLFLAQDYLSQMCCVSVEAARAALPFARRHPDAFAYALLLAATSAEGARIVHLPSVRAHLPAGDAATGQAARVAAVAAFVKTLGARAMAARFGTVRVEWPLPPPAELPLVSVIIPTRDRIDLLKTCLHGVLSATDYPNLEAIIVDNGSTEAKTRAYFATLASDSRVRVLRDDGDFNFSRLNNAAARVARGGFLCLLNNDIEVIEPDWLTAMMRQALRPGVGAVGAKLLYDDGTIQHAGVVIGLSGAAGHAHRFQNDADEGYFAQAHIARGASAVTAACLLVEKAKYEAVGGLDEEAFAVTFNDVDFCLKLGAAGWRNIYEPAARLIHHESKSRDADRRNRHAAHAREAALLGARWAAPAGGDAMHHPALDPASELYQLRFPAVD